MQLSDAAAVLWGCYCNTHQVWASRGTAAAHRRAAPAHPCCWNSSQSRNKFSFLNDVTPLIKKHHLLALQHTFLKGWVHAVTWLQKGCWAESQFITSTGGLKTSPSPWGPHSQHCLCCRMRVLLSLQGQRLSSPGQCRLILLSPAQNSSVIMNLALAGWIPNLLSKCKGLRLSTDTLPWPGGNAWFTQWGLSYDQLHPAEDGASQLPQLPQSPHFWFVLTWPSSYFLLARGRMRTKENKARSSSALVSFLLLLGARAHLSPLDFLWNWIGAS